MNEAGNIVHLEGKTLACCAKDLDKLASSEGCELRLVSDTTCDLDTDSYSDVDDAQSNILDLNDSNHQSKEEQMRREFLSLALNSNGDPSRVCSKSRFTLADLVEDKENETDQMVDFGNSSESYVEIHKRYRKHEAYDKLIDEGSFQPLSSGFVFKRKNIPGNGAPVKEDTLIIYNCAFWTEKSPEPYDSTWLRHSTLITDMCNDSILPGLYELLMSMKRGELSEAFLRPEVAFGKMGAEPRIPANATIFCVVQVTKVIPLDKIKILSRDSASAQDSGISIEEFYEASDEARKRGNYYYDMKEYNVALQRYKSGIRILEALTYKDEQEEKKSKELLLKLYNNTARSANALCHPRLALAACKHALQIDELSAKAYWNRMIAWKLKGHTDRALNVARRAMQLFSDDQKTFKSFKREADILAKQIREDQVGLKELHRIMGRSLISSKTDE